MNHSEPPFPENPNMIASFLWFSSSTTYTTALIPINIFRSHHSAKPSLFHTVSTIVSSETAPSQSRLCSQSCCAHEAAKPLWPNSLWPARRLLLTISKLTPKCPSSISRPMRLSANIHCSMLLHKLDSPGSQPRLMSPHCSPWSPELNNPEC